VRAVAWRFASAASGVVDDIMELDDLSALQLLI
jgi:hypothetical protein